MKVKLALLAVIAGALAVWPARVVPSAHPGLQHCLELAALPKQIGPYSRMQREFRPVMGGMDLWAQYAVAGGMGRRAPAATIYLTFGLGPRAWHPWMQSYRLQGDIILTRAMRTYPIQPGSAEFETSLLEGVNGERWAEATMRCQRQGCLASPLRTWMTRWWAPQRTTVAVHVSVLAPGSPPTAWYQRQMASFLQYWSPATLAACLAREHRQ